jgi:hypothetical protein
MEGIGMTITLNQPLFVLVAIYVVMFSVEVVWNMTVTMIDRADRRGFCRDFD